MDSGYDIKDNYCRYFNFPIRSSDDWQKLYNKHTSIERCNSRLKDNLNTNKAPVSFRQVIVENILGIGANIVATREISGK